MTPDNAPAPVPMAAESTLSFNLLALCRASGVPQQQVRALVDEGLLQPSGQGPLAWRFDAQALARLRLARRLARDFELDLAALCLVMDLLAEIERLRTRQRLP